jgi:hypothetical protein
MPGYYNSTLKALVIKHVCTSQRLAFCHLFFSVGYSLIVKKIQWNIFRNRCECVFQHYHWSRFMRVADRKWERTH